MAKVTAIGGVFIKAEENEKLQAWYDEVLGVKRAEHGAAEFWWKEKESGKDAFSIFCVFDKNSNYFEPSSSPFMINFRVDDLDGIPESLKERGVKVFPKIEEEPYGRFAWIEDPAGNKVELWEPKKN